MRRNNILTRDGSGGKNYTCLKLFLILLIGCSALEMQAQCGVPGNFAVTDITSTEIDLSWDAAVGAISYSIAYFTDSTSTVKYVGIGSTTTTISRESGGAHNISINSTCGGGLSSDPSTLIMGTCDIIYNTICRNGGTVKKDLSLLYKALMIEIKYSISCFCEFVDKHIELGDFVSYDGEDWFIVNCDDIRCPEPPFLTTD